MNTFSTSNTPSLHAWCAVVDPASGEVVHIHGFTGNTIAADTDWARAMRSETALAHVQHHVRKNAKGLEVVHGDPKKLPEPGTRVTYDMKRKKLVASRVALSLQDFMTATKPKHEKPPKAEKPQDAGGKPARKK
jgi:hypothetical protein